MNHQEDLPSLPLRGHYCSTEPPLKENILNQLILTLLEWFIPDWSSFTKVQIFTHEFIVFWHCDDEEAPWKDLVVGFGPVENNHHECSFSGFWCLKSQPPTVISTEAVVVLKKTPRGAVDWPLFCWLWHWSSAEDTTLCSCIFRLVSVRENIRRSATLLWGQG